jgi:hypothetical protein
VAGFFSTVDRWENFETKWNQLLERHEIPHLQMSALHARKKPFDHEKWNREDYMASFLSEAGRIVCGNVERWAVDLVNYGDFTRAVSARPGLKRFTNPYGLCGTAVALRLQNPRVSENIAAMIKTMSNDLSVEHFFEEGDDGIRYIEKIFARCGMSRPIVRPGKPRSDNPSLRYYVHFQAADWLAFETRKLAFKSEVKIRASLKALLSGVPGEAKKWKYDDLLVFCDRKKKRGQME